MVETPTELLSLKYSVFKNYLDKFSKAKVQVVAIYRKYSWRSLIRQFASEGLLRISRNAYFAGRSTILLRIVASTALNFTSLNGDLKGEAESSKSEDQQKATKLF